MKTAEERNVLDVDAGREPQPLGGPCEAEPRPAEAKFNVPGFAVAAATRSVRDFHPFEGAANMTG
jgi:hypothetical protein